MRRYSSSPVLAAGTKYGTSETVSSIREAVSSGAIKCSEIILSEKSRLDVIAGIEYGDSSLWWIIAAASNIGWGLQTPPGTVIKIPKLEDIGKVV